MGKLKWRAATSIKVPGLAEAMTEYHAAKRRRLSVADRGTNTASVPLIKGEDSNV